MLRAFVLDGRSGQRPDPLIADPDPTMP